MKAERNRATGVRTTARMWAQGLAVACMLAGGAHAQPPDADLCRSGGLGKGRGWLAAADADAAVPEPDPVGGMGGTGALPDEGHPAGGTIFGTVTRFGSICVNGVEIMLPPDMPVRMDGRPVAQSAIGLGQVVRVDVRYDERRARGEAVTISPVVAGPVTAREPAAQRFTVMGRTVRLGSESMVVLSGASIPEVGTRVAVSGLVAPDGVVVATRLESLPEGENARVAGVVRDRDGQYFDVEGVTVKVPKDVAPGGLRIGDSVSATGTWDEDVLQASAIERSPVVPFDTVDRDWLSVEGYLAPCRNRPDLYWLGGVVVDGRTTTDLARWSGRRVVALGTFDADRVLRVRGLGLSSLDDRVLDPGAPLMSAEPTDCRR